MSDIAQNTTVSPTEEKKKSIRKKTTLWNSHVQVCNMYLTDDSTPYSVKVIHPGLLPEASGRKGCPQVWNILVAAKLARVFAMHTPIQDSFSFMEYDHLTADCYTFIAASQATVSPSMYDISIPKWPLQVELKLGHIGRTSLSTIATFTLPRQPEAGVIFHQTNQIVLVDRVYRRPIPIPDYWRVKYKPYCVSGEPLIIKKQDPPPDAVLLDYEMKVAWSDTDIYNHTNFSSYPRFAINAVHDALKNKHLEGWLTKSDVEAGVAEIRLSYLGESLEGDLLHVKTWKVLGKERTVMCSIEKNNQVINQVMLTFHKPLEKNGLSEVENDV